MCCKVSGCVVTSGYVLLYIIYYNIYIYNGMSSLFLMCVWDLGVELVMTCLYLGAGRKSSLPRRLHVCHYGLLCRTKSPPMIQFFLNDRIRYWSSDGEASVMWLCSDKPSLDTVLWSHVLAIQAKRQPVLPLGPQLNSLFHLLSLNRLQAGTRPYSCPAIPLWPGCWLRCGCVTLSSRYSSSCLTYLGLTWW